MDAYEPVSQFFHKAVPLQKILQNHERWIRERQGQKADLIGADLSRIDLSGAYLRGADLVRANLRNSNLEKANLSGANLYAAHLSRANMKGANLRGANLEKANLMDSILQGADISEANLKSARMAGADLHRVSAVRSNLTGAFLQGAILKEGDFYKADLQGAVLIGTRMDLAKLKRANLSGANLLDATLREVKMADANLSKANFAGARMENSLLQAANLRDSDLSHASLAGSDLTGADFSGIRICETDLSGCVFTDIICTHVLEGEANELIHLNPEEFQNRYGRKNPVSEMIVEIPLTGAAYYIARFITSSINSLMGTRVIDFQGAERLSETHTRFIFGLHQGEGFIEKQRTAFERELPHALNGYFVESGVGRQPSYMGGLLEDATRDLAFHAQRAIPEKDPFQDKERAQPEKLMEYYSRLEEIGKDIYGIIHSVFRGTPS